MNDKKITKKNILILGGSGHAREVAWLISDINKQKPYSWNIIGFWEGEIKSEPKIINNIPLIGVDKIKQYTPELYAIVAIGNPQLRQRAANQALELGCKFATLIHPLVHYDQKTVTIGEGSMVFAGGIISTNVMIMKHVIINYNCTISHDCVIEDFVTLSPACNLAGFTKVKQGAHLGIGSSTIEKHSIGKNSIIGAGAVVTTDIPDNVTAVGVPARVNK
jgi:sugar O-acyltransferase (sialic acid O-acetyltransferase NeuD family)